jgi:hypothetical protein
MTVRLLFIRITQKYVDMHVVNPLKLIKLKYMFYSDYIFIGSVIRDPGYCSFTWRGSRRQGETDNS